MSSDRPFYVRVALILYAVWFALYYLVGVTSARFPSHSLTLPLDAQIPFIETFVWAYILSYIFPFLPLLLVKDGHRLNVTLLSIILTNLIAYFLFLNFPVAFTRGEPGATVSGAALSIVYGMDMKEAANNFPSLHVIFALTVCFSCHRQSRSRTASVLIPVAATFIMLSTLFVKQHVLLDVAASCILSPGGWALARSLYPRLTDVSKEPPAAFLYMLRRLVPYLVSYLLVLLFATALHYGL